MIRNEDANPFYTTAFMCALFEQEGGELFDVRQAILGHLQQGGDPSPFDRILATRMASESVEYLIREAEAGSTGAAGFIGLREGKLTITPFDELPRLMDLENKRPKEQWWRQLAPIAQLLAASRVRTAGRSRRALASIRRRPWARPATRAASRRRRGAGQPPEPAPHLDRQQRQRRPDEGERDGVRRAERLTVQEDAEQELQARRDVLDEAERRERQRPRAEREEHERDRP